MKIVIAEDAAILRDGLIQLLTDRGHEVACLLPSETRRSLWTALQKGAAPDAAREQVGS